jgi:hypothetical protein
MASELDPVEALFGGKWFWPILCLLNEFEGRLLEVIPFMEPVLRDDSPDWSFRCVQDVALKDGDFNGVCEPKKLNARAIGRMVGSKVALCDSYAAWHVFWKWLTPERVPEFVAEVLKHLPPDHAPEIDAAYVTEFVEESTELTRKFSEKLTPRMQSIKKEALSIVADEGGMEEVDFFQGFVQGTKLLTRVADRMKPTENKRKKDTRNRDTVFLFAALFGAEIDEIKGDSSWPELHEAFMKAFDYKGEMDEDTFKKILSRKGLKGVGGPGKRVREKKFEVKRIRPKLEPDVV